MNFRRLSLRNLVLTYRMLSAYCGHSAQETIDMSETNEAAKASSIRVQVGPSILLSSGSYFDFLAPERSAITIEDVAYGLGYTCRFSGQCMIQGSLSDRLRASLPHVVPREILAAIRNSRHRFYSVAEHCVRMSRIVPPGLALDALGHEMGEPTCGDMTSPLKSIVPAYKVIEDSCNLATQKKFGVTMREPDLLKHYDLVMLATERRDLMPSTGDSWGWIKGITPDKGRIVPWSPDYAARAYLRRYRELAPATSPRRFAPG